MPMIAATAATRATTAAPPVKGAPTLAGGDFALAIAGLFGGGEDIPGEPEVAAGATDKLDGDRQDDADGGTTLPGIAPPLDPALAWLPFAPVDAAVVPPADVAVDANPTKAAIPSAAVSVLRPAKVALPVVDTDGPRDAPTAPPTPSTTVSAIATSSLTPIPMVAPRIDADPAAAAVETTLDPMPAQMSIDSAVLRVTEVGASPVIPAANPIVVNRDIARPTLIAADPFASAAASVMPAPSAQIEAASVVVPPRFRAAAPTIVATPTHRDPIAKPATTVSSSNVPLGRSSALVADSQAATAPVPPSAAAPAAPVATTLVPPLVTTPQLPVSTVVPTTVPPLPTAIPAAQVVSADIEIIAATPIDTGVIAVAASVPVAPAAFLRQIVADAQPPVAPLAVVVPDPATTAPTSSGIVFGAAIRAAASASEDKPALATTDPLAPVATPVVEVRTITATTGAQQAPLDMSQPRWPHAMIERIDQLRDAINAVDTRIRLIPDALGQIDVSIRQDGDTTHVTFAAEQAATRTMLQDAAPRLTAIAEERGLKLGQSTTDTGQQPPSQQRQATQHNATNRAPVSTHADRDAVTEDGDGRVA